MAEARMAAWAEMPDAAGARARARAARAAGVSRLAESLDRFTEAAERQGVQVHRAKDAAEACHEVSAILTRAGARLVVKSKSMAGEEIGLREHLEAEGREVVETDLGEWLVQLAGQAPSHIIAPAVHLNLEQIRGLLSAVAGRTLPAETRALAAFARAHLRQKFLQADAGISGGNLLIAETGSVVIVSNEGNARMCTTLPRIHVAVVGVEKVVPTWAAALDVLAVLPRAATGQRLTQYVSFLSGPRRPDDPPGDGPDELHVVLLDNGRSRLVGTPVEELLYCIRCGACMNVCPVYRTMGGHAYGTVYPGPIGAALMPHLTQGRRGRDLPWASSLCGACREACPVEIQLDDQLIALRAQYPRPEGERLAMRVFAAVTGHPTLFAGALRVARVMLRGKEVQRLPGPLSGWTSSRALRGLAPARRLRRLGAGAPPPVTRSASISAASDPPQAGPVPPCSPPASPARQGVLATFVERWRANGGTALVVSPADCAAAVREAVGPGPVDVDSALASLVAGIPAADAAQAAVGLLRVEAAVAETCSVVLRSGPGTMRRRSLLPPRAVFVFGADDIHADLPAAFAALGLTQGSQRPAAVTLVSGPSRSADIEHDLVIGVHGPGDAWAIVVEPSLAPAGAR
jgi:L-lactate dehydrogenase complex protein LldF